MNTSQTHPQHIPSIIVTVVVVIVVLLLHIVVLYWLTHIELPTTNHRPYHKSPFVSSVKPIKIELINLSKETTKPKKPSQKATEKKATANKETPQQATPQKNIQKPSKITDNSTINTNNKIGNAKTVNTETSNKTSKATIIDKATIDKAIAKKANNSFITDNIKNNAKNDKVANIANPTHTAVTNEISKEVSKQNTNEKPVNKQKISPIVPADRENKITTKTETSQKQAKQPLKQRENIKPLIIEETRTFVKTVTEPNSELNNETNSETSIKVNSENKTNINTETVTTTEINNESSTNELNLSESKATDKTNKIEMPEVEDELFSQYYRANKRSIAKVYDGSDNNMNVALLEVGLEVSAKQAFEHLLEPIFLDGFPVTNQSFNNQSFSEQDKLTVYLFFYVDTDGNVMSNPEPFIDRSSGNAEIDNQALAVILSAKFKPFTRNGKPVIAQVVMPLGYNIKNVIKTSHK